MSSEHLNYFSFLLFFSTIFSFFALSLLLHKLVSVPVYSHRWSHFKAVAGRTLQSPLVYFNKVLDTSKCVGMILCSCSGGSFPPFLKSVSLCGLLCTGVLNTGKLVVFTSFLCSPGSLYPSCKIPLFHKSLCSASWHQQDNGWRDSWHKLRQMLHWGTLDAWYCCRAERFVHFTSAPLVCRIWSRS